ncbi:MAG: low molecular weight phosphotyrosine protein phosphatase [Clostridia bacterium]|nr:low molecular weight phosphotyrosine protein phosphatase [Clostridia bacterium]
MKKILFLCHGNICRSPMAEFTLKQMTAGRNWQIDSKAVSSEEEGNPMDPRAQATLKKHGVPFCAHRAEQVTREDYDAYDLLIVMESYNLFRLGRITGEDTGHKVFRLLDFTDTPGDIEDPWYSGRFDFVWEQIRAGCLGVVRYLDEKP